MKIVPRPSRLLCLGLAVIVSLATSFALGSAPIPKRSKLDRDLSAIGHRTLYSGKYWPSLDREKAWGEKYSTAFEQARPPLHDAGITSYMDRLVQRITQNSDATLPVTVRVVNSNDIWAFTLQGGHTYVTSGLILQLQSEGELASVLAREIAHTALRSATKEQMWANLMQLANFPGVGYYAPGLATPLGQVGWKQRDELDADYFGIQYLYKSGYDPFCFARAVQKISSAPSGKLESAFSPFPPLPIRLKALQQEINEILPRRDDEVESTSEFDEFLKRLQVAKPDVDARPKLIRHDSELRD